MKVSTTPPAQPNPKAIRAETVSAVASALAAVASAMVAAYALVFLYHQEEIARRQEEIARNQLKATYLSNLYSKQVDNFALVEKGFSQFERMAVLKALIGITFPDSPRDPVSLQKYQNQVKADIDDYDKFHENVASYLSMKLVSPKTFANSIQKLLETHDQFALLSLDIINYPFTANKFDKTVGDINALFRKYWALKDKIVDCANSILNRGSPITTENVVDCHLDEVQ